MKLVMMLENGFGNVRTDHRAETKTFTERGSGHSHFFIVGDKEQAEGHSLTEESSSQSFIPIFPFVDHEHGFQLRSPRRTVRPFLRANLSAHSGD